ncbi:MAG: VCBS domain-containing protein [Hyphomicrobiales bacterium]
MKLVMQLKVVTLIALASVLYASFPSFAAQIVPASFHDNAAINFRLTLGTCLISEEVQTNFSIFESRTVSFVHDKNAFKPNYSAKRIWGRLESEKGIQMGFYRARFWKKGPTKTPQGASDNAIVGNLKGNTTEDGSSTLTGSLQIPGQNGAARAFLASQQLGKFGDFEIGSDGAWKYKLNTSLAQTLGAGASYNEVFSVQSADGKLKQSVTLTVKGANDVAAISGIAAGTVTEDSALSATGKLTVTDADANEAQLVPQSGLVGRYGTLSVSADGTWSYALNNAKAQPLGAGQSALDTFTVTSKDGSATSTVNVTVNGANDAATINGTLTGSVTEDSATSKIVGTVTVADADAGQAQVQAQTNVAGQYGTFSIGANGQWTYQLDNTKASVQALGNGQTATDNFTIKSLDGSKTETVKVVVNGVDEGTPSGGTTTGGTTTGGTTTGGTTPGGGTTGSMDGMDHHAGTNDPATWHDYRPEGLQPSSFASVAEFVAAVKTQAEMPMDMGDAKMNAEHSAVLALVPRDQATSVAVKDGSWFDPTTWADGKVPGDGAKVLIPQAIAVTYDGKSDASIFTVRVDGHLDFATDQSTKLKLDTMVVSPTGHMTIGTETHPVQDGVTADIVFADNGPIDVKWDPLLLSRGLISQGSVEVQGQEKCGHLKVAVDPMAGDTQIVMQDLATGCGCGCGANWKVGDKIVLTGTHYVPWGQNGYNGTQDEVRTIKSIDGNVITLDSPLQYNHDTPQADLKAYVANYTRNVVFETEHPDTTPVSERGHTMFMHSPNVDVQYAEFNELGRTDKSYRAVDANASTDTSDTNVKGRYAFHLHMTGTDPGSPEATVVGNAVWGSPGWGFAQHSSSALFQDNATYNTFGAGYVAEKGDETGKWLDNIAIKAEGDATWNLVKEGTDVLAFDLARNGEGYWFQGRLVESQGNVAAGVKYGFVYMTRGTDAKLVADNMDQPEALRGLTSTTLIDHAPIQHFLNNEVMASWAGLWVTKAQPSQEHDVRSVFDGFKAWEVWLGAHVEYTAHYTFKNFDLIGTKSGESWGWAAMNFGLNLGVLTYDMALNNVNISGFGSGLRADKVDPSGTQHPDWGVILVDVESHGNKYINYENTATSYDTILTASQLKEGQLYLKTPWTGVAPWGWDNMPGSLNTITKYDSVGAVPYKTGTENLGIDLYKLGEIVKNEGYWKTSDGKVIMLVEEYFSDRATGEIQKVGIPVSIPQDDPNQPWLRPAADWKYNGMIDLSSKAPVTGNDSAATGGGNSVTIDVLGNDSDPEGNQLFVDGTTRPDHGTIVTNADGTITYTPDHGFVGTDKFYYWATDHNGNFTRASVAVDVYHDAILQ